MSGCLREDRLYAVGRNEGDASERAHLDSCAVCARELKLLQADLDLVTSVLMTTPVPRPARWALPVPFGLPTFALPGFAMAAAAVLTVTFVVGRISGRNPATITATRPAPMQVAAQSVSIPGEAVSIGAGETEELALSSPSYVGYVEDAFGSDALDDVNTDEDVIQ